MSDVVPSGAAPEGANAAPAEGAVVPAAQGAGGSPAAGPGGGPGEADPAQVAEALEGRPKKVAPIKNPARLPGVVLPDDELDSFINPKGGRDSRGRFVKPEGAPDAPVGGAGDKPVDPSLPPPKPGEGDATVEAPKILAPDPTTGKIKFADKEYESPAQIEQEFKTLRGMFKPMNDRLTKLTEERDYGYSTAQAWIDEVKKKDAIIARLQGGGGGDPSSAASSSAGKPGGSADPLALPSAEDLANEVDADVFEAIAVEHGLPQAIRYLSQQMMSTVVGKVVPAMKAQSDAALAPYHQARQTAEAEASLQAVADSVAALQAPDGTMAFPELGDAVIMGKVAQMWQAAGLPPEVAMTSGGLMAAISMYRTAYGMHAKSSPAVAPTSPAAPVVPSPIPAPAIAASIGDHSGGFPGSGGRSALPAGQRRLLAALDDVELVDRNLGFKRNQNATI